MIRSVYALFAPVAQFLLIRRRMTDIDLRLDPLILRRYMIAKQVYLSFSDDSLVPKSFQSFFPSFTFSYRIYPPKHSFQNILEVH